MRVILKAQGADQELLFEVGVLPVTVGRQNDCMVRLKDKSCSHHHCMFWVEGKKLYIEDNQSKNGTFVNGVRITRNQVFIQDRIVVGDTVITVSNTHNMPEVIQSLNFPGTIDDRTSIGITLQTSATLDLIRLNPRSAMNTSDRKVLGKRITQKIIRPRGYEPEGLERRWKQSWRHWLAAVIDIGGMVAAFLAPFAVLLWMDDTLDAHSTVKEIVSSPNMAVASLGSLLSGVLFRNVNLNADNGSIGERICGIASEGGRRHHRH